MHIVIFTSPDEQRNTKAMELLYQIKGIKISEEATPPTLAKKVKTPFIQRPDGGSNFGLSSIQKFVERILAKAV